MKLYLCLALGLFSHKLLAHDEFVNVIAKSKSAVVMIEAVRKQGWLKSSQDKKRDQILGDYADFFADDFKDLPKVSSGSGFFVSENGLILTAAHVVRGSDAITVDFINGESINAELVRVDSRLDLALLKVAQGKQRFSFLTLSEQEPIEGQTVLSMGSAFGLPISSSLGIVSAIGVKLSNASMSLLQTDAATNPGSSGGPLFNSEGEVVGLLSKIYSSTATFSGAAFAVTARDLAFFLEQDD